MELAEKLAEVKQNINQMTSWQYCIASKEGYLVYGTVSTLVGTIENSKSTKLKPYPKPNCDIFSTFVNKVMMHS